MVNCKRETLNNIILKHETSTDFHFSHETFHIQLLIGRARGEGSQVKLYDDDDDDDDDDDKWVKPSIDIRLPHFSRETFGAQFLIGRTRGEGGQVVFFEDLPKIGFKT